MASASVTTRRTKSGTRYVARYRLGGRSYPLVHGGSFKTLREARARRDLIAGELAAGRNPADLLRSLVEIPITRTFAQWGEAMVESRIDISDSRRRFLELALRTRINPTFGPRYASEIKPSEIQEWIATMTTDLKARSVQNYWQVLAQVFDFADVTPNPAKHKTVKLPFHDVQEAMPPSTEHLARDHRPARATVASPGGVPRTDRREGGGASRLGMARRRHTGVTDPFAWREGSARYAPCLVALCAGVADGGAVGTGAPDDRTPERKLFPGLNEGTMRDAIGRASRALECRSTARMISAIGAARCGTGKGCPPASWRSGWATRTRQCRSTCTRM